MDGEASDMATGGLPSTDGSEAAVPDPAALRPDTGDGSDGEPPPVRDPAAPPPHDTDEPTEPEQGQNPAGLEQSAQRPSPPTELGDGTPGSAAETVTSEVPLDGDESDPSRNPAAAEAELAHGDVASSAGHADDEPSRGSAAPQTEPADEAQSVLDDARNEAVDFDGDPAHELTFLVPVVGVGGGANSALRGASTSPDRPSACPGFRPYSETPVYSDSAGVSPSPPPEPAPPPPPDQPCSGDWHHKTVDDLIAMDVPDVRIPRCVNTWGACEIRGWLRRLDLEQYVAAMLNNGICGRRLCLLTASNLPRIGITDWQHIRAITASVRSLLSVDDYVPYERQLERPPPGGMTRALYLQCARPTGPPPPSSARYRDFLRQHGFLDVLLELTNRPVVDLPQPQPQALYREIPVPPVPSHSGTPSPRQSESGSPAPRMSHSRSPGPRAAQSVSPAP